MNPGETGMEGEICVANIGGRQRRTRLAFGLVMAALALLPVVLIVATGAPRLWLLAAAPPIWMAAVGILQYRGHT